MTHTASNRKPRDLSVARRLIRMLASVTGLVPMIIGPGPGASAQQLDYRPAAEAPAAWRAFAAELQTRLQERLANDDEATRRFHAFMEQNNKSAITSVTVRTWVAQNGRIERIEFDSIDDATVTVNLRALLADTSVSAPPADMLQPLRLRLGLQAPQKQEH